MSPLHQTSYEPAAISAAAPSYIVGRDPDGHWIALESHGLAGGIFRSQADAADFAAFETAHRPGAVRLVSEPVSLRL